MWKSASALNDIIALNYYKDYLRKAQYFNKERDNIRN